MTIIFNKNVITYEVEYTLAQYYKGKCFFLLNIIYMR